MKKVSIIYWSNGGNVEIMANAIAEGASIGDVEVETKNVADSSLEDVLNSDAVAFGSPAMPFYSGPQDLKAFRVLRWEAGW